MTLLGLVPGCMAPGGIQASARTAWRAIQSASSVSDPPFLFCYGDAGPGQPPSPDAIHTTSRYRAVRAALAVRRDFGLVVAWHMDLLKLLPFFRLRHARVALILQGIEAWRRRAWPERALLRRVDLFISISDYTWRRFATVNPEYASARHQVVPLGLGEPYPGPLSMPAATPIALMLSRLARAEDYKGHRQMIDAWPEVRRHIPDAELWIAGEGDLRPDLERATAERGLGQAVRFLGFVSEQHKQSLIGQARCLAIPSRGEGFGLVYLEAMRLGRPCLVGTQDAGREVVDPPGQGLAADPDDRDGLTQATCRLLTTSPEWQTWSIHARQHYECNFTADHYQQRLLEALASVPSA
jgi:phosphatidylinositol alpha-1,6-mannosyltransferase